MRDEKRRREDAEARKILDPIGNKLKEFKVKLTKKGPSELKSGGRVRVKGLMAGFPDNADGIIMTVSKPHFEQYLDEGVVLYEYAVVIDVQDPDTFQSIIQEIVDLDGDEIEQIAELAIKMRL